MQFTKEAINLSFGKTTEERLQYISNEFFGTSMLTDAKNFLMAAMPDITNLFGNVRSYMSNLLSSSSEELKDFTKEQQTILRKLKDQTFLELSEVLVPIPENFRGKYIEYLCTLESIVKDCFNVCLTNISDFRNHLSLFLSTSDYKKSVRDLSTKYKALEKYRTDHLKTLGRYFPKDTSSSRTMLKNVVDRIKDFEEIYAICNRLSNIVAGVNVTKIKESVDDCYETLTVITNNLSHDNTSVSKEAAKSLSVATYEMAKFVEFVAVLYFDTTTAIKSAVNMGGILTLDQ